MFNFYFRSWFGRKGKKAIQAWLESQASKAIEDKKANVAMMALKVSSCYSK